MSKNIKIRGIRGIYFIIDQQEYQSLSEYLPSIVKSKKILKKTSIWEMMDGE